MFLLLVRLQLPVFLSSFLFFFVSLVFLRYPMFCAHFPVCVSVSPVGDARLRPIRLRPACFFDLGPFDLGQFDLNQFDKGQRALFST